MSWRRLITLLNCWTVSTRVLELFCYVYSDEVSGRNVMWVLYLAKKYVLGDFTGWEVRAIFRRKFKCYLCLQHTSFRSKRASKQFINVVIIYFLSRCQKPSYSWRFNCMKSDITTVTAACVLNLKWKYCFLYEGCNLPWIMHYESLFMTLKGLSWGNQWEITVLMMV